MAISVEKIMVARHWSRGMDVPEVYVYLRLSDGTVRMITDSTYPPTGDLTNVEPVAESAVVVADEDTDVGTWKDAT